MQHFMEFTLKMTQREPGIFCTYPDLCVHTFGFTSAFFLFFYILGFSFLQALLSALCLNLKLRQDVQLQTLNEK